MTGPEKPPPWPRNSADPARRRVRRCRSGPSAPARMWCRVKRTNEPQGAIRDLHNKPSPSRHTKCTNRRARIPLRPCRLRLERYTAKCCGEHRGRYSNRRRTASQDSRVRRARRIEDMSTALPHSRSRRSCRRWRTSSPGSRAGRSLRSCRNPRRHRRRLHRQRQSCRRPRPRRPQSLRRRHRWSHRPCPLRRSRQYHRGHLRHRRPRLHRFHRAKLHRPRLHRRCRLDRRSLRLRHCRPSRLRSPQHSRRDRQARCPRWNRATASVSHQRRTNTRPSGPTRGSQKPACPRP